MKLETELRKLVWKLLINFQRIDLFLLQYGLLVTAQLHLVCHNSQILPSITWNNAADIEEDEEYYYLTVSTTTLTTLLYVS